MKAAGAAPGPVLNCLNAESEKPSKQSHIFALNLIYLSYLEATHTPERRLLWFLLSISAEGGGRPLPGLV